MRRAIPIARAATLLLLSGFLLPGCSSAPVKPDSVAPGDYEYTRSRAQDGGMGETVRIVSIHDEEEFYYSGYYLRLKKK